MALNNHFNDLTHDSYVQQAILGATLAVEEKDELNRKDSFQSLKTSLMRPFCRSGRYSYVGGVCGRRSSDRYQDTPIQQGESSWRDYLAFVQYRIWFVNQKMFRTGYVMSEQRLIQI